MWCVRVLSRVLAGCGLLVGSPVLGVGIYLLIEGQSGGVVDVPVCCDALAQVRMHASVRAQCSC